MRAALPLAATAVSWLAASACLVAGAGAGAGGAVYFTSRGAESVVAAPVEAVAAATERAFDHLGIERTELVVEGDGARREVKGEPADGDPEVTVTMRREGEGTTRLVVTARTSLVTWDRDYARGVIEKIVEFATGERPEMGEPPAAGGGRSAGAEGRSPAAEGR